MNPEAKLLFYQIMIFATMFVGYACYAYNRKSVSFAMPKLFEEGMAKNEAGLIASSQNMAYAISKFIGGILSDKISSRYLFSSGLLMSGFVTIAFSNSDSVAIFTLLWFCNGLAQGAGWPACAKILKQWYSPSRFGTFWSLLSASTNISGGVSPFIAAYIILHYDWRTSVFISGAVSIVFGVIALLLIVNAPTDVGLKPFTAPRVPQRKTSVFSQQTTTTTGTLLKSPFLWLIAFCYMSVFCSKTSTVDWGQLYLMEDRQLSQYAGSGFTSSVESGGFFGGILAGYLTDVMLRNSKPRSRGNPRMPIAIMFMIGVTACLHLLRFNVGPDSSQLWVSAIGFALGACLYGPIAIFGVVASESAPAAVSGTAHAIVALAANVGAIISGLPFSIVAKYYNWSAIFLLLEVLSGTTVVFMITLRNLNSEIGKVKVN